MAKNNKTDLKDKLDFNSDNPIFGGFKKTKNNAQPKTDDGSSATTNAQALPEDSPDRSATEQPKKHNRVGKMGRPKKLKPTPTYDREPREADYLGNETTLPYSTGLTAENYLLLKRLEFYEDTTITKMINEAVAKYVKRKPAAQKPLPEPLVKELKPLRTSKDYYWSHPSMKDRD